MKNIIIVILLVILAVIACQTARTIDSGIAWDFGGIDKDGLFLCPAAVTFDGQGNIVNYWSNPLAPIFPELVTDC